MDALKSKLVEFNGQVSEDKRLSDEDVIRLTELPNTGKAFFLFLSPNPLSISMFLFFTAH